MQELSTFLSKSSHFSRLGKLFKSSFLNRLGRKTGFIRRDRTLSASAFCYVCLFFTGSSGYLSIQEFIKKLWQEFGIKLSKSALFARFNPLSVELMRQLLESVLGIKWEQAQPSTWLRAFSDVIVSDSSIINLDERCAELFPGFGGGASKAGSKIQLTLGLLSGTFYELSLFAARQADSGHRFSDLVANALYLFDLGYVNGENLRHIIDADAYFLCRYKYGTQLYTSSGTPISQKELDKKIQRLKPWKYLQIDVLYTKAHKTPCRLVIQKLPKEVADQVRHQLSTDKQKKLKNLSKGRLDFCQVNAYLTNIPPEKLPKELSRACYAIRWQIEILFKSWKSFMGIELTRTMGPYQFQTYLYAHLIRVVIQTRLFWSAKINVWIFQQKEFSELKALKDLFFQQEELFQILTASQRKKDKLIANLYYRLSKFCIKERRKMKPTPFEVLNLCA